MEVFNPQKTLKLMSSIETTHREEGTILRLME